MKSETRGGGSEYTIDVSSSSELSSLTLEDSTKDSTKDFVPEGPATVGLEVLGCHLNMGLEMGLDGPDFQDIIDLDLLGLDCCH